MIDISLEDCIIRIAEVLKLSELEIVMALQDNFQGVLYGKQVDILEELYWEFTKN